MTVAGPGHDECQGGPHRLALPVKVVSGHLIQGLIRVPHLRVDLLGEGEGLLDEDDNRKLFGAF